MNILLIGNGFDMAHKLPATYADFLKFVEVMKQILGGTTETSHIDWKDINFKIREQIASILWNCPDRILLQRRKWEKLIADNCWIEYFLQCQSYIGENWIDFESEISRGIQEFDKNLENVDLNSNACREKLPNNFFRNLFMINTDALHDSIRLKFAEEIEEKHIKLSVSEYSERMRQYEELNPVEESQEMEYKEIIRRLEDDLNKLILALEIYIADYVDKLMLEQKSPDIVRLLEEVVACERLDTFISFNYSHTLNRVYGVEIKQTDNGGNFDFIHGEARTGTSENNMILGIDEYIKGKGKNKNLLFLAYKKYYQRIYKETGNQSKCWADTIKKDHASYKTKIKEAKIRSLYQDSAGDPLVSRGYVRVPNNTIYKIHNLYIFGHSLDITDKDILKSLILNDNVHTTIFYHNEEAHAKQITNLVKVIGQEELIKRTSGLYKTISFQRQADF